MVLVRGIDARGVCFYTNRESRKGRELAANPHGAIAIHWHPLAAPDPARGTGRAALRRGVRRLLREPSVRQPAERLGVGPEQRAARLRDARAAGGRVRRALSARRCRARTYWGGYLLRPDVRRVLAGPSQPAARPHPPRPRGRRLERGPARALMPRLVRRRRGRPVAARGRGGHLVPHSLPEGAQEVVLPHEGGRRDARDPRRRPRGQGGAAARRSGRLLHDAALRRLRLRARAARGGRPRRARASWSRTPGASWRRSASSPPTTRGP